MDAIYDCAFDPEKWNAVLPEIAEYTGSDSIALDFMDLTRQQPVGAFSHGFSREFRESLVDKYASIWVLQSGMLSWEVGRPMHLPDILPREEFLNGIFYREWCAPQRNEDYVGMIAFRDATRFVKTTNARVAENGPFPPEALERIRLLAPHICRSVSISDAFSLERVRTGMFETMLDNLTTGVYLLNEEGSVEYMNPAAKAQLADSPLLHLDHQTLRIADRNADRKLRGALTSARDHIDKEAAGTEFLAIGDGDQAGFIATVLPLTRMQESDQLRAGRSAVAIFLRDPVKRPTFAVEAFADFYKLTPGEARVAAVLGQGGNLGAACDILGITLPTAKTHLQRIFEKTGVSRQSDLIAVMTAITH
ncbi:MAG: LuxR C-terminal-related transcriptional regulator [Oricola sp.]